MAGPVRLYATRCFKPKPRQKSVLSARAFQLCTQRNIVVRGLKFSMVVGTILVLINQSDIILQGQADALIWTKVLLTYTVPYIVSTLSSVQATLVQEQG